MQKYIGLICGLACCLISSLGCNSAGLVEVTGIVKVDGNPTPEVTLMFFPADPTGITATATSDENGKFTISSGMDAGITKGKYAVTATWPDPAIKPTPAQMMQGTFEPGPDLLKGKYSNKQSTPLQIEITGAAELPAIELKKG